MKRKAKSGEERTGDYWPAYPGPQQEEEEERDVLPPVMRTFQPNRDSHHHHHHQPPPLPSHHQEVRRTPSFAEKIREAEENPGVRFIVERIRSGEF